MLIRGRFFIIFSVFPGWSTIPLSFVADYKLLVLVQMLPSKFGMLFWESLYSNIESKETSRQKHWLYSRMIKICFTLVTLVDVFPYLMFDRLVLHFRCLTKKACYWVVSKLSPPFMVAEFSPIHLWICTCNERQYCMVNSFVSVTKWQNKLKSRLYSLSQA